MEGGLVIDLPLASGYPGRRDGPVVPAEIVPGIAPHLALVATFAVHESADYAAGGLLRLCEDYRWRVSNVETGAAVSAADAPTRAAAIARARAFLASKTLAQLESAFATWSPAGDGA